MLKKIWSFIISIRLAIGLLIILSIVCVIGTVVPQNLPEQDYTHIYSASTFSLLKAAGFLDMYHAWWFLCLLGAFTFNLIACSFNRLPRILRLIAPSNAVLNDQSLRNMPLIKNFTLKNHSPQNEKKIVETIARVFTRPTLIREAEKCHFFSEKGRFSYCAFYLTHLGMMTIIIGVVIGTLGFQGYINLTEGETSHTVTDKKSLGKHNLDFAIRCEKFEVTYYDNQMPKEYTSILTIIENGKAVLTKTIEVNNPLIYKGIYFYQSSYGMASGSRGVATLRITPQGSSKGKEYPLKANQRIPLEGTGDEVMVESIVPDFAMDEQGKFFSRSDEPRNPAVRVTIYPQGRESYQIWAFANFPDFHKKPDQPYTVELAHFSPLYYTGLQVTRDPGVWTVWVGCTLMIFGIYLAFFTSHRRIWLILEEKNGNVKAVLAGTSNKNKAGFAVEFTRLFEKLKTVEKI